MNLSDLIRKIKEWAQFNGISETRERTEPRFTGIVKVHYHNGGVRDVAVESKIKK